MCKGARMESNSNQCYAGNLGYVDLDNALSFDLHNPFLRACLEICIETLPQI